MAGRGKLSVRSRAELAVPDESLGELTASIADAQSGSADRAPRVDAPPAVWSSNAASTQSHVATGSLADAVEREQLGAGDVSGEGETVGGAAGSGPRCRG